VRCGKLTADSSATYGRRENRCYEKRADHISKKSSGKKVKGHVGQQAKVAQVAK
jgi:hypothetical protein